MTTAKGISSKEKMAINGWKIWDSIIADITDSADLETTACFVVIEEEDFPVSMIDDLIRCYANARKVNNICVISNFYDVKNLMCLGKNLEKIQLSEYEIDCLLTYYAICEFTDLFYVFSFHKMGRRIPRELCQGLSRFEMAAAGILKMKKSEMERWHE